MVSQKYEKNKATLFPKEHNSCLTIISKQKNINDIPDKKFNR